MLVCFPHWLATDFKGSLFINVSIQYQVKVCLSVERLRIQVYWEEDRMFTCGQSENPSPKMYERGSPEEEDMTMDSLLFSLSQFQSVSHWIFRVTCMSLSPSLFFFLSFVSLFFQSKSSRGMRRKGRKNQTREEWSEMKRKEKPSLLDFCWWLLFLCQKEGRKEVTKRITVHE